MHTKTQTNSLSPQTIIAETETLPHTKRRIWPQDPHDKRPCNRTQDCTLLLLPIFDPCILLHISKQSTKPSLSINAQRHHCLHKPLPSYENPQLVPLKCHPLIPPYLSHNLNSRNCDRATGLSKDAKLSLTRHRCKTPQSHPPNHISQTQTPPVFIHNQFHPFQKFFYIPAKTNLHPLPKLGSSIKLEHNNQSSPSHPYPHISTNPALTNFTQMPHTFSFPQKIPYHTYSPYLSTQHILIIPPSPLYHHIYTSDYKITSNLLTHKTPHTSPQPKNQKTYILTDNNYIQYNTPFHLNNNTKIHTKKPKTHNTSYQSTKYHYTPPYLTTFIRPSHTKSHRLPQETNHKSTHHKHYKIQTHLRQHTYKQPKNLQPYLYPTPTPYSGIITFLQCGDIQPNPGPTLKLPDTFSPQIHHYYKKYFIPQTISLKPDYYDLYNKFIPLINICHPNHSQYKESQKIYVNLPNDTHNTHFIK